MSAVEMLEFVRILKANGFSVELTQLSEQGLEAEMTFTKAAEPSSYTVTVSPEVQLSDDEQAFVRRAISK